MICLLVLKHVLVYVWKPLCRFWPIIMMMVSNSVVCNKKGLRWALTKSSTIEQLLLIQHCIWHSDHLHASMRDCITKCHVIAFDCLYKGLGSGLVLVAIHQKLGTLRVILHQTIWYCMCCIRWNQVLRQLSMLLRSGAPVDFSGALEAYTLSLLLSWLLLVLVGILRRSVGSCDGFIGTVCVSTVLTCNVVTSTLCQLVGAARGRWGPPYAATTVMLDWMMDSLAYLLAELPLAWSSLCLFGFVWNNRCCLELVLRVRVSDLWDIKGTTKVGILAVLLLLLLRTDLRL